MNDNIESDDIDEEREKDIFEEDNENNNIEDDIEPQSLEPVKEKGFFERHPNFKRNFIITAVIILILYSLHYFAPNFGYLSPLDRRWQESSAPAVYIDADGDFPFEFVGDGYRFVEIITNNDQKKVKWEWQYEIKNTGDRRYTAMITFILEDREGNKIAEDRGSKVVNVGEKAVIEGKSTVELDEIRRVNRRAWKIGRSFPAPFL